MLLFFGLVPPCDSLAVVTEMRLIVPPHNGLPLHDTCECVCACMCVIRTDIYIYIYQCEWCTHVLLFNCGVWHASRLNHCTRNTHVHTSNTAERGRKMKTKADRVNTSTALVQRLGWQAEGLWFRFGSLLKGSGLSTLSCDFVPHN